MPLRTALRLWLPPLALMAVIFYLSDQPDLSTGLGIFDLVGRKVVHAGEYALLCALWWRTLRPAAGGRVALVASLTVSILYAVSDEVHQSFVPGRTGTPIDVAIDAVGASLAALAIRRRERRPAGSR